MIRFRSRAVLPIGLRWFCKSLSQDGNLRNKALGAVFGAFYGDAAGATLEFPKVGFMLNIFRPLVGRASGFNSFLVPFKFCYGSQEDRAWAVTEALKLCGEGVHGTAPGQITDDGELTLSLLAGLQAGKSKWDLNEIAGAYVEWISSMPFDVGNTCKASTLGVYLVRHNIDEEKEMRLVDIAVRMSVAARVSLSSQANGSLMRATPLGIWGHKLTPQELEVICFQESALTHPHLSCCAAVTCYSIAIAELINDPEPSSSLVVRRRAFQKALDWITQKHKETEKPEFEQVINWLEGAQDNLSIPFLFNAGWIGIGFAHAFRHLYHGTNYQDAIFETILGGGDTDTNAAIVGGLIGAAEGYPQLPENIKILVECDTKKGTKFREAVFHPRNAFDAVDQILAFAPEKLECVVDLNQVNDYYVLPDPRKD